MCGRYALGIRASFVRYQLQQQNMPVDNAPEDDEARQTYNFPPGSYGLVYRADVPDSGGVNHEGEQDQSGGGEPTESRDEPDTAVDENGETTTTTTATTPTSPGAALQSKNGLQYELKVMKWGLIPFWTKRSPDYGSMLRTINCRDDSLIENRGMWNTMKQRKRCIVIAQGFYEWLKKGPGGKQKVPHFVKRKDGQLMCFAGLWDCVKYEDTEGKLYTYTIITTDSNKQLNFLHDRMPVILDPDTDAMRLWLDPSVTKWSNKLQTLLKPYQGELECYPVSSEVGKVGNDSPNFIIPIDSKENKKNIANFFGNTQKNNAQLDEKRVTVEHESTESHAPLPLPPKSQGGTKRKADLEDESKHVDKTPRIEYEPGAKPLDLEYEPGSKPSLPSLPSYSSPDKSATPAKLSSAKKARSATSNEGLAKKLSPVKADGSKRITSFFGRQTAG